MNNKELVRFAESKIGISRERRAKYVVRDRPAADVYAPDLHIPFFARS